MNNSDRILSRESFSNREYSFAHSPFEDEFRFYNSVTNGNWEEVRNTMTPLGSDGKGVLSENALQNLKYHFVITIALVTRFCVEAGMELEVAYTISDIYISRADKCTDVQSIHKLHYEAIEDFTHRMKSINRQNVYSKPVVLAMDYIYDHLHEKIYADDVAEFCMVSVSHLSRQFHAEAGVTMSEYILMKKVDAAKNMLKYSEYSSVDISNYLAFSSHSHFISKFKKYVGMTPAEYRKKFFRVEWKKDE